jgi:uncharacterized protein (DUF1697 family)
MPELREALASAGFENVRTYVQSGNVVLETPGNPAQTARSVEQVVARRLGLQIPVVVRTKAQLARVVEKNPLAGVAKDPKRYQVSFLASKLDPAKVKKLEAAAAGEERLVVDGREIYAWHDAGVARSKLWAALAAKHLGVTATARNWTTVEALLALADER